MSELRPLGADVRARMLQRLREQLVATELDGILLLLRSNVVWATGFDPSASERPLGLHVPVDGEPTLYVPLLEREHAMGAAHVRIETYEEFPGWTHPVVWMVESIARGSRARTGVDALGAAVQAELDRRGFAVRPSSAADRARAVKEPEELALIRAASRHADACLAWILGHGSEVLREGERAILDSGLQAARELQAHDLGSHFDPSQVHVVGTAHSGWRAALPHGHTSDRVPRGGDVLIAGIGARVGGYHAESGATFMVGDVQPEVRRALATVAACAAETRNVLRPGLAAYRVNDAAMAVLREAGYGDCVRHRIGHGMGVDGHEAPWLAPGDETVVAENMVFSCEPGIYRPGIDGYRTIDTLIVTESAPEVPSRFLDAVPWQDRVIPVR